MRGEQKVSVDKVGLYFREAQHIAHDVTMINVKEPPTRIIFDVSLQGTARKRLTVRSALMIHNKMEEGIMLRLEHHKDTGLNKQIRLDAHSQVAVPLSEYFNFSPPDSVTIITLSMSYLIPYLWIYLCKECKLCLDIKTLQKGVKTSIM